MNHPNQSGPNPIAPGIALLVVGILSLLSSVGLSIQTYMLLSVPDLDAILEQQERDMTEDQKQIVSRFGGAVAFGRGVYNFMLILSCVGVVLAALTIVGGFGLMKGSKGLGLLGGAAALIPQWCCIVGLPIGIWAIVVALKLGKTPPQNSVDSPQVMS